MTEDRKTLFVSGSFVGTGNIARTAIVHLAPCLGLNVTYKDGAVDGVAAELIAAADYFVLIMGANDPAIQSVYGHTLVETEIDFAGSRGVPIVVVLLNVPESISTADGRVPVSLPPFTKRLRSRMRAQYPERAYQLHSLVDLPATDFDTSQLVPDPSASLVRCAYELLPLLQNLEHFAIRLMRPMSAFEQGMRQLVRQFMNSAESIDHVLELEPRAFEHFMYNLYQEMGHEVELTPESGDGGRDLIVTTHHGRFLIELKRWKSKRVGVKVIEKLEAAMEETDRGVVITTSGYTDEVLIRVNKCQLGGPDDIMYLLDAYRAGDIGAIVKDEAMSARIIPGRATVSGMSSGTNEAFESQADQHGSAPEGDRCGR